MAQAIQVDVEVDPTGLEALFNNLVNDDIVRLAVHNTFAKDIDPWVPYLNNPLSTQLDITPDYIRYTVPYAHYQYEGVNFNHTTDYHPLASAHWDQVAMQTIRESFEQQVKDILIWRASQLYG